MSRHPPELKVVDRSPAALQIEPFVCGWCIGGSPGSTLAMPCNPGWRTRCASGRNDLPAACDEARNVGEDFPRLRSPVDHVTQQDEPIRALVVSGALERGHQLIVLPVNIRRDQVSHLDDLPLLSLRSGDPEA